LIKNFVNANKLQGITSDELNNYHDSTLVKTVAINNKTTLIFSDNGGFAVDTITSRPAKASEIASSYLAAPALSVKPAYAAQYTFAENDYSYCDMFGWELWTVHVESHFGYNGSSAWYGGGLNAYYKRFFAGGIWQVQNWNYGTTVVNGGQYCRAYADGNFNWGVEIEGIGWLAQDIPVDLRVSCTEAGTIYKN
jgi:hypothetical protein